MANLRTCDQGHKFLKSSDCPVCPVCEKLSKPTDGFLSLLAAPARRALMNNGINTLEKLSSFSDRDIRRLHGIGPASIPVLKKALSEQGLCFKPVS